MAAPKPVEVRYGLLHNISMVAASVGMIGFVIFRVVTDPGTTPTISLNDSRFVMFSILVLAMAYYVFIGLKRCLDRTPQLVIDQDGITLGFGRNRRIPWSDIPWVGIRRLAIRPQLQIGIAPETFLAADLKLSNWNLDDNLRSIRGAPAAVMVRDNGLDISASAMLDAVKAFQPNLIKA
ncbi:MAG: hypothetical protein Q8M19_14640 [Reyranella sp.]|nr:hypothetical protein [Reyranella sp.]